MVEQSFQQDLFVKCTACMASRWNGKASNLKVCIQHSWFWIDIPKCNICLLFASDYLQRRTKTHLCLKIKTIRNLFFQGYLQKGQSEFATHISPKFVFVRNWQNRPWKQKTGIHHVSRKSALNHSTAQDFHRNLYHIIKTNKTMVITTAVAFAMYHYIVLILWDRCFYFK